MLGGITVLTKLNPWVVGLHFLASIGLITVAYALWRRTAEGDRPAAGWSRRRCGSWER